MARGRPTPAKLKAVSNTIEKTLDLYDGEGGPQEAWNLHIEEEEGAMPGEGDPLLRDSPSVLLLWDPSQTNRHYFGSLKVLDCVAKLGFTFNLCQMREWD